MINPTRFIPIAREYAKLHIDNYPRKRSYHISIINYGKSFVIGVNGEKSHPDTISVDTLLHSELAAFIKVKNLTDKDLILINFRFNKQLDLRMSKPCASCMRWCRLAFSHIYYSTNSGKIVKMY